MCTISLNANGDTHTLRREHKIVKYLRVKPEFYHLCGIIYAPTCFLGIPSSEGSPGTAEANPRVSSQQERATNADPHDLAPEVLDELLPRLGILATSQLGSRKVRGMLLEQPRTVGSECPARPGSSRLLYAKSKKFGGDSHVFYGTQ